MTKRVYHPSLNSWQDVPDGDVDRWAEAGWRKSKPKHADDYDAPEVGAWAPVDVPRFLEPQAADEAPAKADTK